MRFRATDNPVVIDHARERWRERGPWDEDEEPAYSVGDAWRLARDRPIHWGKLNATYVRFDSQTHLLLIAQNHHSGSEATLYLMTVKRAGMELDRKSVREAVNEAMNEDREQLREAGFEMPDPSAQEEVAL